MGFFSRVFSQFSEDRCSMMAAALAYYTVFALPPLLYLLLIVITGGFTAIYGQEAAEEKAKSLLQRQAGELVGDRPAAEEIASLIDRNRTAGGTWWKTLLSVAGVVVGATGVVAALQDSLNRVWGVKPDPETAGLRNVIAKRLLSLAMILGLGLLLLVSFLVSTLLALLGETVSQWTGLTPVSAQWINYAVQALVAFAIFAAILKFMPDARIQWRDVAIGAAVTTVLFTLGRYLLSVYLSRSGAGAEFGSAAASLAVILIWVYYSAMIFLFGAELTQAYATQYGSGIEPEDKAVRVYEGVRR